MGSVKFVTSIWALGLAHASNVDLVITGDSLVSPKMAQCRHSLRMVSSLVRRGSQLPALQQKLDQFRTTLCLNIVIHWREQQRNTFTKQWYSTEQVLTPLPTAFARTETIFRHQTSTSCISTPLGGCQRRIIISRNINSIDKTHLQT